MAAQPYTISVSDDVLEDLRHRLMHVRWPDEIPGPNGITGPTWTTSRSW